MNARASTGNAIDTLSDDAAHALCKAYGNHWRNQHGYPKYWLNVAIGGRPWEKKDRQPSPRKRHLWELRQAGLIYEWFSPWSKPTYVTKEGERVRRILRKRLGYD
jgi:hypothetical protein